MGSFCILYYVGPLCESGFYVVCRKDEADFIVITLLRKKNKIFCNIYKILETLLNKDIYLEKEI